MRFEPARHLLGDLFTGVTPTSARLADINTGAAGVADTLTAMRQFARDAIRSPTQDIRELALNLTRSVPERDWGGEIVALHGFVRDQIRYVMDPDDLELVARPEKTLQYMQGDCDDKSTLLGALLSSIGHPARFAAIGLNGLPFSHVLVETQVNSTGNDRRDWLPLETILQVPPGWWPPGVTSKYVKKI